MTEQKQHVMETLELCLNFSVDMSKLKNIWKRHLRSIWKSATEQEKRYVMETLVLCCYLCYLCVKAKEYYEKALVIRLEIGDKKGEATNYDSIGMVFQSRDQYVKANEYH